MPFMGGSWKRLSDEYLKIGGRRAKKLEAIRQPENSEALHESSYAVLNRGEAFIFTCSIPQSKLKQLEPQVEGLLDSFQWRRKPKIKK
jgi:hypothetical protein